MLSVALLSKQLNETPPKYTPLTPSFSSPFSSSFSSFFSPTFKSQEEIPLRPAASVPRGPPGEQRRHFCPGRSCSTREQIHFHFRDVCNTGEQIHFHFRQISSAGEQSLLPPPYLQVSTFMGTNPEVIPALGVEWLSTAPSCRQRRPRSHWPSESRKGSSIKATPVSIIPQSLPPRAKTRITFFLSRSFSFSL